MERLMIALYDSTNHSVGYNLRAGGDSGGTFTEESKKRMSEAHKGRQTGADNPRAKRIIQYDLNNNFIKEWDCIKHAAQALGVCRTGIGNCCGGRRKSAAGYLWRYKE